MTEIDLSFIQENVAASKKGRHLKISQANKSTLLVSIVDALQDGTISKYGSVELPKGWGEATTLALTDDFSKSLTKHLDGSSLDAFVRDRLAWMRIAAGTPYPKEKKLVRKA